MQDWLRSAGLGRLTEVFEAQNIERADLAELTDADLRELGLTIGERKRFRRVLAAQSGIVAALPATLAITRAERRPLTIMFVDLVGSTALAERCDGEDFMAVLQLYRQFCAEAIERYGGRIAQLMGDGILAYFCYPVSHEDDSARAVRAALDITSGIGALTTPAEVKLQVRIGIAGGRVVISSLHSADIADFDSVIGSVPNRAARLQTLSSPDGVIISELVHERVAPFFACIDLGRRTLKGFGAPEHVFRVLRPLSHTATGMNPTIRLTPLINREAELASLTQHWADAQAGRGSAVLIVGEPGIGKSRLIERFVGNILGDEVVLLRVLSSLFDQDSTLRPFLDYFRQASGVDTEQDPAAQLAKLAASLHDRGQTSDLAVMADLLSLQPEAALPTSTPGALRRLSLDVLSDQILAAATRSPACLVVEDFHWLDPTSRELLKTLIDQVGQHRLLILVTARDTALDDAMRLGCGEAMTLKRLRPEQVANMLQSLFTDAPVPASVVRGIIQRSDGVPLFIEEVLRPVLRSRTAMDWSLLPSDDAAAGAVPSVIHETLMAWLDRSGGAIELAQAAAVIGRAARRDILAEISGLDPVALASSLATLGSAGLLHLEMVNGQECAVFSHALLRDTAYDSLLREQRVSLHARTARVLAALEPEAVESQPELLALHLTEGGLGEEALEFWITAGRRSLRRSAMLEASRLLRRGLDVVRALPPTPALQAQTFTIMGLLGPALIALYGPGSQDVQALYAEAYASVHSGVPQAGDDRRELQTHFPLLWGWWRISRDFRVKGERSAALLSRATRLGDPGLLLQAHHCQWASCYSAADLLGCQDHIARGMVLYRGADYRDHAALYGNHDPLVCAHGELAQVHWMQGRLETALEQERLSRETAHQLGHLGSYLHGMDMAILHRSYRREHSAVATLASELMAFTAEHGLADHRAKGLLFQGWSTAMTGDASRGVDAIASALARQREIGTTEDFPIYVCLYAEALIAHGRADRAADELMRARADFDAIGLRIWMPEVIHSVGRAILAADPASTGAAAMFFEEASVVARAQDASMLDLRVAVSQAELWAKLGDEKGALVRLEAALAAIPEPIAETTVHEAWALRRKLRGTLGSRTTCQT